jgi:hypothetical protein
MILRAGAVASLFILLLLAVAHSMKATFLSLESRWLIVSGIPLLVALIAGGYLKRFKGLGIELEGELQRSVDQGYLPEAPVLPLQAAEITEHAEIVAKESLDRLVNMPPEKRKRVKRLSFIMQRHYVPHIIEQYFQGLPKLAFLEVQNQSGALVCILRRQAITETNMQTFVDSLARGTVVRDFANAIVDKPVRVEDSFLVAIEKLRNSGLESLPVIDGSQVVGLIDRYLAFERLAAAIVEARLRS